MTQTEEIKINRLTPGDIEEIKSNQRLFTRLVEDNKNFIHAIVSKFHDYDYPVLYQEGVISLWKAINKYDPDPARNSQNFDNDGNRVNDRSINFSTFAHRVVTNDVLQVIRKENKKRAKETPIERYVRTDDDAEGQEYVEKYWKNLHTELTNFEDIQVDKLQREKMLGDFSELEKQMYHMRVVEKRKVTDILDSLAAQRGVSKYTIKNIYYKTFRPKMQKRLGKV